MKVMVVTLFLLLGAFLHPSVTEDTPVQCPNWNVTCTKGAIENKCDTDLNCCEGEKCCDVCGRRCFNSSILAALASCPVLIEVLLEGSVVLNSCETNRDCDPELRCCNRCGRKICTHSDVTKNYPVWVKLFPDLPWKCDVKTPEPTKAQETQGD